VGKAAKNSKKDSGQFTGAVEDLPNPPLPDPFTDDGTNPFDEYVDRERSKVKQVWSIGGGKGGVGKSLLASSLGIALARAGNKVVAVDLDLGGANLHTTLGMDLPKKTLTDFFNSRIEKLQDCLADTPITNLQLLSGANDAVGVADLEPAKKDKFIKAIHTLDTDYVLCDLGAGTNANTLDFFLASDVGLVILLPEPTSIENGYRFIKSAYYRRLLTIPSLEPIRDLIETALDSRNTLGLRTPGDLFRMISSEKPDMARKLKEEIEHFRPKLIINQARTQTDVDIGFSIKSVCKKYFGIEMDYVGYLDYDSAVWQAVRRKRPLMIEFPNSRMVSSVERITHEIIKRYSDIKKHIF